MTTPLLREQSLPQFLEMHSPYALPNCINKLFQILLRHGDKPDYQHIAQREPDDPSFPEANAIWQQGNRYLYKAVKSELFEHTRMKHGSGTARGPVP